MPSYSIEPAPGPAHTGDTTGPTIGFRIRRGSDPHERVDVKLSRSAWDELTRSPNALSSADVERLLVRHSVHRIELALASEADDITTPVWAWTITSYEVRELLALRGKQCEYQLRERRNLYCGIPAPDDPGALDAPVQGRRVAVTTSPICSSCSLPDTDIICSHLLHPMVTATGNFGDPWSRRGHNALCDRGRPEIDQDFGLCRPGGHECWERIVEAEARLEPDETLSSLTLPEAFDFLDAIWRLVMRRKVFVAVRTVADAAGLALDVVHREDFEARTSDLADILDNLQIFDEDLPSGLDDEQRKGSLNRIEHALVQKLSDPEAQARARTAVSTLRRVRRVRNGFGHSGAAQDLPAAFADLSLSYPPLDWSSTWDQIRRRTRDALATIRDELQRLE